MLVSAVVSAILFTILVWCHLNPWSRFKFRRDEVMFKDEKNWLLEHILLQDQDTDHKIFLKGEDLEKQVKLFVDCEDAIQKEFENLEFKTKTSKKISRSAMAKQSINESQISFPGLMHSFIATKVPKTEDSMIKFWKMVHDEEVKTIVMLTPLENTFIRQYVNFKAIYLPTKEKLILNLKNGISLELRKTSSCEFWEKRWGHISHIHNYCLIICLSGRSF